MNENHVANCNGTKTSETGALTADNEVLRTFTVSIQEAWCKLRARRRSISADSCVSPFPIHSKHMT